MNPRTVTLVLGLLCAGCSSTQPGTELPTPSASDLEPVLRELRISHGVDSLGAAVIHRSGIIAIGVSGRRSLDANWHLASCTKAMTATLIAQLVRSNRLRWESTLGEVFAASPLAERIHPGFRNATVAELLEHCAGLPHDRTAGSAWELLFADPAAPPQQRSHKLSVWLQQPPAQARGQYCYSNRNYVIAGAIIDWVTGRSWEEVIRQDLLEPLGMSQADLGSDAPPHPAWYAPAGGVHASLAQWAKFAQLHMGLATERVGLDTSSLRALHTPAEDRPHARGFVVASVPWAQRPLIGHDGQSSRGYCAMRISPHHGWALLVACDRSGEAGQRAVRATLEALRKSYPATN